MLPHASSFTLDKQLAFVVIVPDKHCVPLNKLRRELISLYHIGTIKPIWDEKGSYMLKILANSRVNIRLRMGYTKLMKLNVRNSPRDIRELPQHLVQCLSPLAECKKCRRRASREYKSDINDGVVMKRKRLQDEEKWPLVNWLIL
ncbi:hypothetical protein WA026_020427 [Henosepilachna vigintioctopunctata]|uniref:Uncharacterized protein n=1 Tax=Henosepilachna vigintioctopunctata TaxID=420089 RepID=A0AAW1UIG1_9CUCU